MSNDELHYIICCCTCIADGLLSCMCASGKANKVGDFMVAVVDFMVAVVVNELCLLLRVMVVI